DNSADETNFLIERSTNGVSDWTQIYTATAGASSYNNTGLAAGTIYYYRVRAYRSGDASVSDYSNTASATTLTSLGTPSSLSAMAVSTTQINLNWQDNSGDESSFRVERSPNGTTGWTEIYATITNATTYSSTVLTPGATYYYRVRAYRVSDASYSAYSNIA